MDKKKKEIPKPRRKIITEIEIMHILNLFYKKGMSKTEIGKQYECTRQNIYKIIKNNKKPDITKRERKEYDSREVEARQQLDPFERTKLIKNDAMSIVELSISMAKFKINETLEAVKEGGEMAGVAIELDKLTRLLSTALPYVLEKVSVPNNIKAKEKNKTPTMRLNRLMNDNNSKTG